MFFKRKAKLLTILFLPIFFIVLFFTYTGKNLDKKVQQVIKSEKNINLSEPEISGWIAWWAEKPAYELVQKYPDKIKSVSPVWFMLDKDLNLEEVGESNKEEEIKKLKEKGVKIMPTIGSELTGKQLSPFFNSSQKTDDLEEDLINNITSLGVDGLDVDIEGISEQDKEKYTELLENLANSLHKKNLKISITVHAQNGKEQWEGVLGQNLERIGEIADEVRIMTYDEHSASSSPGPIASFDWITSVAIYNLKFIPKEKINMGIPSYGYIWPKSKDPKGLQFDEFNNYLDVNNPKNQPSLDKKSSELVYSEKTFTGWLSNSRSMIAKIEKLRSLGINRFAIWHLGGMDERFFEKNWSTQK